MSITENTTPNITHFNKKAFDNYEFTLTSLNADKTTQTANVKKEINFFSYGELGCKIESIIDAIQIISYSETQIEVNKKLTIVYDLAEILKELIPQIELEFVDDLLVHKSTVQTDMINIKKI